MFIRETLRVSNGLGDRWDRIFLLQYSKVYNRVWLIWECRVKWRVIIVFWRLMHARL